MGEIVQKDFTAGWRPSDAEVNGIPNALLRMQNVKLDEVGALTLIPGSSKVFGNTALGTPNAIFSKTINSVGYRFYTDTAQNLYVSIANAAPILLVGSLSTIKSAFNACFNQVLVCSNGTNQKYIPSRSTTQTYQLGHSAPAFSSVSVNNPYTKDMTGTLASYTSLGGVISVSGSYVKIVTGTGTVFQGSAYLSYGGAVDSTSLSSSSVGLDSDRFTIEIKVDDPSQLVSLTVIFKDNTDPTSYYQFSWRVTSSRNQKLFIPWALDVPPGQAMKLQCQRGDFESVGFPSWANIGSVVVQIVLKNQSTNFYFNNLIFAGGTLGSMNGELEYIQRFYSDYSTYRSYSELSSIAKVTAHNASVHVAPYATADAPYTNCQIFRRGGGLDAFYLVKDQAGFTAFDDTVTDQAAILTDVILDENEKTLFSITDDIKAIVGPFFNRWIYFTPTKIYVSKDGNPESYSQATGILTPYGTSSEIFLWAKKIGNAAILVGTTGDVYEITGTFTELPDGTIDSIIRPTGCQNPPLNTACAATNNELYYVANDGIRIVNPTGFSTVGNGELDLLFKGKTRYAMIPPRNISGDIDAQVLAISRNELYWSFLDTNGLRKMFAYDLLRKYWYEFKSSTTGYGGPVAMFTEEDGNLLAAYTDAGNNYGRILNTGQLIDGTTNPEVYILSKVSDGGLIRNRKDFLTLKLRMYTGGSGVEVFFVSDYNSAPVSLGFISTSALQDVYFDLSAFTPAITAGTAISGNAPAFKLADFSIDYIERPPGLTYLRTETTNFGVQGLKKLYELPFVVDTLGSEITVTAYLDGAQYVPQKFNTGINGKQTLNYTFPNFVTARDVFLKILLTTGTSLFEFYGLLEPKVIELLPDTVVAYTVPNTNFNTYSRKRFISYAVVIDSDNQPFTMQPIVDSVTFSNTLKTFTTVGKQTAIYYFDQETTGVDLGMYINCPTGMRFYGVNLDDSVSEKLPPSTKFFRIPSNNFGVANKKRLRTVPLVIDTKSSNVTFEPFVDGVTYQPAVFNTREKRTVLYYFETDAFGIDLAGTLTGSNNFEFYGILTPETVEVLPVAKKLDQLGPVEFKRNANIRGFRVRLLANTVGINYSVYVDDVLRLTDSFSTTVNVDKTYEVPWLRKFLNGTTCRIELSASSPFHRFSSELRVAESGAATSGKWVKL